MVARLSLLQLFLAFAVALREMISTFSEISARQGLRNK